MKKGTMRLPPSPLGGDDATQAHHHCGRGGEWIETDRMETKHYCLGCGHEWKINPYRWLWPVGLCLLSLAAFLLGRSV